MPTIGDVINPGKYPLTATATAGCATPLPAIPIAKNQTGKYAIR